MTEIYDLHCHSTASDGALSPQDLVRRAKQYGVTHLALTDHDTVAGVAEAQIAAEMEGINLITGIEFSTTWQSHCLHIVGLNLDPSHSLIAEGSHAIQTIRNERAEKISGKLEKKRILGAFESVKQAAGNGMITRTHFAEFLLSQGYVTTLQGAFDHYLGEGKPGYVSTHWPGLEEVINWITASGGIAVLAHPMRYKLTGSWMRRLLMEFKEMGGLSIEVVSGRNNPEEINTLAHYAKQFDLAGSAGSDFHNPKNIWVELGRLNPMPDIVKPVWHLFEMNALTS
jgi:3',5'-nucleoside bisphosphate phosphatase